MASLGPKGFMSQSGFDLEEGVQPSFQDQTSCHQDTSDKERICQSLQEQLPEGDIAFPPSQASGRKGQNTILSGFLQPTVHCPKTKSKLATYFGPSCFKTVSQGHNLQNGNTRVHSTVPSTRRVGHFAGLQQRLLLHPYQSKLKEVPPVLLTRAKLSSFGHFHLVSMAPMEFTIVVKEVKLMAQSTITKQNGPFLFDGARQVTWTSIHYL